MDQMVSIMVEQEDIASANKLKSVWKIQFNGPKKGKWMNGKFSLQIWKTFFINLNQK